MKIPKIFLKVFAAICVLTLIYSAFVFFLFIPKIEKNTIMLEDTLGKAQLQKTVQLLQNYSSELHDYEDMALQGRKDELKKLTAVVYDIINTSYKKSLLNSNHIEQLKIQTLELVSKLKYANNDYFYISDYNSILISHPYLKNKDFSKIRDINGVLLVPRLVDIAKTDGDGFVRYWWKKDNADPQPYEKLTYAKNFAPWQWVVGTGVYIDDIEKELQKRKKILIKKLKNILHTTKIGKNGYVYIFDSSGNMIIHPDKTLEGTNFKHLPNPGKKSYIFDDLINAYKYGNETLYYNWDAPNDRGNYTYKKISWIEYNPSFAWYICSSEYINEVHLDSDNLKKFMIYFTLVMIFLIIALGLYFLKQIFNPIITLAHNAQEVIEGNLDARYTDKINNDEIGILAIHYNTMLDTIKMQMDTLDSKVQDKTKELTLALKEKEVLIKEINHRVKNNLHVINSIIGLQIFQDKEIKTEDFIQTIQHRIQAMAIGHEMLGKNANISSLEVQEYIPRLVQSLINAYIKNPSSCNCLYDIAPVQLELDKLLSCGLIINELVTNAIKYALLNPNNYLLVSLKEKGDNLELIVEDHGSGFSKTQKHGVGIELVEMLVQQINGTINFRTNQGTRIIINFPK